MKIVVFSHHGGGMAERSGMLPLAEALEARVIRYYSIWWRLQTKSFRLGHTTRIWGNRHFGSTWNILLPWWGEWQLARQMDKDQVVAHFLWGEFASPRHGSWFRRKAKCLVGTFHASARRLPSVITEDYRALHQYDGITLMSESQRSFFVERGFPADRIKVILHGVDSTYFVPAKRDPVDETKPLRGLMVGNTERDHEFLAQVLRRLMPGTLAMTILTAEQHRAHYDGIPGVICPDRISDEQLLSAYQQSDLLIMPMLDCTANNVVMEAMACGTPVMVNKVGGIPEYVDNGCNYVMDQKDADAWAEVLMKLGEDKTGLEAKRGNVRAWAEKFEWKLKAREYISFYEELLA